MASLCNVNFQYLENFTFYKHYMKFMPVTVAELSKA
jgi:hypothetical protein